MIASSQLSEEEKKQFHATIAQMYREDERLRLKGSAEELFEISRSDLIKNMDLLAKQYGPSLIAVIVADTEFKDILQQAAIPTLLAYDHYSVEDMCPLSRVFLKLAHESVDDGNYHDLYIRTWGTPDSASIRFGILISGI